MPVAHEALVKVGRQIANQARSRGVFESDRLNEHLSLILADGFPAFDVGSPLYARGLSTVLWAGEVLESQWIADLQRQNRVHPRHDPAAFVAGLRHFILPLKERTVEVVASGWQVLRSDDPAAELVLGRPAN